MGKTAIPPVSAAEFAAFERRRRENMPRCQTCLPQTKCMNPADDGYRPALEFKFSFPDGTDQEGGGTFTRVFQCPVCKDISTD